MNKACTRSSDTVCEPLERFFCIERNKDGCRRAVQHSECRPGQYIKQAGKLSNYINMHGQCMKCCLLLSVLHYLQLRKRAFFICNILCICNYIAFLFYNYSICSLSVQALAPQIQYVLTVKLTRILTALFHPVNHTQSKCSLILLMCATGHHLSSDPGYYSQM